MLKANKKVLQNFNPQNMEKFIRFLKVNEISLAKLKNFIFESRIHDELKPQVTESLLKKGELIMNEDISEYDAGGWGSIR